jgi:glycosyltransferase involved in cell wall biosynthesis
MVPLVLTHQGSSTSLLDDRRTFAALAAGADVVSAVSEAGRDELRALLGHGGVSVVVNGADSHPPPALSRTRERESRPARGRGDGTRDGRGFPLVLTVGRLAAYKGLDLLALALADLGGRGLPCRWLALGPDQTRGRLQRFVRRLGVSARFVGAVPPAVVRGWLRRADVFVQPSRAEGSPMAVLEAMAAGRPVVASSVGGVPGLVGRAGLLVPAGDPAALSRALARVLGDRRLAERLGARARRKAAAFSWDAAARKYMRLYAQAGLTKSRSVVLDSRP